ncbi:hypothetical protein J6590_089334 [Homalodisca vitripennis]|nr:hypothetical protein J6590_089334 [Homalodisca vitripennis]
MAITEVLQRTRCATSQVNITGVCKPSGRLRGIAPTDPPTNHAYVILAGTNDLAAGRRQHLSLRLGQSFSKCGLRATRGPVMVNCTRSSRVLVSPLWSRYNLPPASPVDKAALLANNYIDELYRRHEGIELLDLSDFSRRQFTARHRITTSSRHHCESAGPPFNSPQQCRPETTHHPTETGVHGPGPCTMRTTHGLSPTALLNRLPA